MKENQRDPKGILCAYHFKVCHLAKSKGNGTYTIFNNDDLRQMVLELWRIWSHKTNPGNVTYVPTEENEKC